MDARGSVGTGSWYGVAAWRTCARPARVLGLACVGAAALAGCGDDGGSADPAVPDAGVDGGPPAAPEVVFPRAGIAPDELAVLVLEGDAASEALGAYYVEARGLPAENLVRVPGVPSGEAVLSAADFATARAAVEAALPARIQALALAWTTPYRVECMSITSAFALGFDRKFCNRTGGACGETEEVDYYASPSARPFDDHGLRPTMMLAAADEASGRALVDRGVAADDTFPTGDGYFVRTTDTARSVRWRIFERMPRLWSHEGGLRLFYRDAEAGDEAVLRDTDGVLVYQTGLTEVPDLETNTYLPGAVADHLTSFGGQVPTAGGGQMSVLAWLEAGATASYGTTVEPCNFLDKFPDPRALLSAYVRGATVVEAYWKSVARPGEGLFVGEPLARPWGAQSARLEGRTLVLETNALAPGEPYVVEGADAPGGPWRTLLDGVTVEAIRRVRLEVPWDGAPHVRLRAAP